MYSINEYLINRKFTSLPSPGYTAQAPCDSFIKDILVIDMNKPVVECTISSTSYTLMRIFGDNFYIRRRWQINGNFNYLGLYISNTSSFINQIQDFSKVLNNRYIFIDEYEFVDITIYNIDGAYCIFFKYNNTNYCIINDGSIYVDTLTVAQTSSSDCIAEPLNITTLYPVKINQVIIPFMYKVYGLSSQVPTHMEIGNDVYILFQTYLFKLSKIPTV